MLGSRLAKLEVINPDGSVATGLYEPVNNVILDSFINKICSGYGSTSQTPYITSYTSGGGGQHAELIFSTGVWYPIKYQSKQPATITGNILYAPGLTGDYGIDVSGVGYVDRPTLTGKIVKFNTGEEYYISGLDAGGNIILRNGDRVKTTSEWRDGGSLSNVKCQWFLPDIKGDISTPTDYVIWNVGEASFKNTNMSGYSVNYGTSITCLNDIGTYSYSTGFFTGAYGVVTGNIYVFGITVDSNNIGADYTFGRLANRALESPSSGPVEPFSWMNIPPVSVLSGQKVRATYEVVVDTCANIDSLMFDSKNTPVISGMPTSSGYFIFYRSALDNVAGHTAGFISQFSAGNSASVLQGCSFFGFGGSNVLTATTTVYGIFSGQSVWGDYDAGALPAIPNSAFIDRSNDCYRRKYGRRSTPASLSNVNIFRQNASKDLTFYKNGLNLACGFTLDVNTFNGALLGFNFEINQGAHSSFAFYTPQVKDGAYELSFNWVSSGWRRVLDNFS